DFGGEPFRRLPFPVREVHEDELPAAVIALRGIGRERAATQRRRSRADLTRAEPQADFEVVRQARGQPVPHTVAELLAVLGSCARAFVGVVLKCSVIAAPKISAELYILD